MIRLIQCGFCMVLHPITLVDGVVSAVIRVQDEEVNQELPICQSVWVHGYRVFISDLHQLPFAHRCARNAVCNEEQTVLSLQEEGM